MLEDTGAQSVAAWATAISPGRPTSRHKAVSFTASADTPALFAVQPAIAATGTLTYTPAPNANGVATITVTVLDNGGTANGGTDTSTPLSFTIAITAVNDAPSFSAGASQTVREDDGAQSVAGWATAIITWPRERVVANRQLHRQRSDNPALFTVQPAIAADGTLTYTPAPDANGLATITVTALDNGGTANGGTNTSTAAHLHDHRRPGQRRAPASPPEPNQSVVSLLGAQTIPGWATGITSGPGGRVLPERHLHRLEHQRRALRGPARDRARRKRSPTRRPCSHSEAATVTVRARDNGGDSGGGSDTSAPQTFTITIL